MATGDLLDPFVFVSHDFHVINAQSLTIELDPISAGLDYQPGTYRDVTFGERRRGLWDIYAGWDGDDLVILSRANKLQVMERISLISPNRLRIIVGIEAEKKIGTSLRFLIENELRIIPEQVVEAPCI